MTGLEATLLVFTRAPVAGEVKRRLIPVLGAEGACALYCELLRHTLTVAAAAGFERTELWCAPAPDHPFLRQLAEDWTLELRVQKGEDLGRRMQHALARALRIHQHAVLIGCDCPELEAADLRQAAEWLHADHDAVLGPAADGGYYLIGLNRADDALFMDIEWGGHEVMAQTRRRLQQLGCRWRELPVRHDVDRPEDLEYLRSNGKWRQLLERIEFAQSSALQR